MRLLKPAFGSASSVPSTTGITLNGEVAPLLSESITYLGHLNHAHLRPLIAESQCGLVTSTWDEPFGLVTLEMLACGIPVVAFDSGATGEVLDRATGFLVPKFNVAELARALPATAHLSRAACRRRAEEKFSVETMMSGYERVYRRAVEHYPKYRNTEHAAADITSIR